MDNLLFYTLLIAIAYYSLVYLPAQKSHSLSPNPLTHSKNTQTDPLPEPKDSAEQIKNLQSQITALTQNQAQQTKTIQQLETKKKQELEQATKQISALKQQITQATQTQQQEQKTLGQSLDTLIKGMTNLSQEIDKY